MAPHRRLRICFHFSQRNDVLLGVLGGLGGLALPPLLPAPVWKG